MIQARKLSFQEIWDTLTIFFVDNDLEQEIDRAFVNFVDGRGWLARRNDLTRLVENRHYILNLHYLNMLEAIVLDHVPAKYFQPPLLSAHP